MADVYVDAGGGDDTTGTSWATAYATLDQAITAATAGQTIAVANTHSEAAAVGGTKTWAGTLGNPVTVISSTTSDVYTRGASITYTTGGNVAWRYGAVTMFGVDVGTTSGHFENWQSSIFYDCHFSTTASYYHRFRQSAVYVHYEECDFSFASGFIWHSVYDKMTFLNCTMSAKTSGAYCINQGVGCNVNLIGFDFSTAASGTAILSGGGGSTYLSGCTLPPSGSVQSSTMTIGRSEAYSVDTAVLDKRYSVDIADPWADAVHDDNIYLSADAGDGTGYSIAITPNTFPLLAAPFRMQIFEDWCDENPTFRVHLTYDSATTLQNDEVWLEIEYPDATDVARRNLDVTSRALPLAAPADISTTGSTWTGNTGFNDVAENSIVETIVGGAAGVHIITICYGKASGPALYVCPDVVVT